VLENPEPEESGGRAVGRHELGKGVLRMIVGLLALFFCYRMIVDAAGAGISRLLQTSSIVQSSVQPADVAVRMTPADPEAHYTRALALVNLQRLDEALIELRKATELRPHHYYEWLDLGVTLDRVGDHEGAVTALRESVRLAPFYAQPRWQLGNLLYRQGEIGESFDQMRLAVKSDPDLFSGMTTLAWAAASGDPTTVQNLAQPENRRSHFELALMFARQGAGPSAAQEIRRAGEPGDQRERNLLYEIVKNLLDVHQFADAYDIWRTTHPSLANAKPGEIINGSFVDPIIQDNLGFGWQSILPRTAVMAIDPSGPASGTRSLRLEFAGDIAAGTELVHQLVLTQPNSHYLLTFTTKSEELVSGGPPVFLAVDESRVPEKIIGQSTTIPTATTGWTENHLDFYTDEKTSAVRITLQRLACTQLPCPIFGKLWLSGFSLVKKA
jgi:Tetratricopeptide repeat